MPRVIMVEDIVESLMHKKLNRISKRELADYIAYQFNKLAIVYGELYKKDPRNKLLIKDQ